MDTVTVILPTFNRSSLLQRAIESLRNQTWKNQRILIRDDCSTDNTKSVVLDIASNDPRIIYESLNEKLGAHENIRKGIKSVESEYFSFLCDDDYLEPDFYSEGIRLFKQYPDASFIVFRVDTVNLEGKKLNSNMKNFDCKIESKYYNSEDGLNAYLKGLLPCNLTGYMFRRNVAQTIDYGEFSEVGYGADVFFIWHAAARFNFVVTNFKGGNFTSHVDSTSATMVKCFDERIIYWWRNRMLIIINDPKVSTLSKNRIKKLYMTHPTKSLSGFKYYTHAAIILMINRVKKKEFNELEVDLIKMLSFLPWPILIFIKLTVVVLVYIKLDNNLRKLIRGIRKSQKSFYDKRPIQ